MDIKDTTDKLKEIGVKPRTTSSAIFNMSKCYSDVSALSNTKMIETNNVDYAAPTILCLTFSIELLLKYFIFLSNPSADKDNIFEKMKCHKFVKLFDKIQPDFQLKIANSFGNVSGNSVDHNEFRENLAKLGNDPFVEFRYAYEAKNNLHMDTLQARFICDALGKAAEVERKKEAASS